MSQSASQKKQSSNFKNPLEVLSDLSSSTLKNTVKNISDIGSGMVDQLFGGGSPRGNYDRENHDLSRKIIEESKKKIKNENKGVVFNYQDYHERVLIKRQIKDLTEMIKKEIDAVKKSSSNILSQIKDVESLTINELPEKPGVYHIRFLEIVLGILRSLRAKVSESATWLSALLSRKKKRGSLFALRAKKMGTQYSLSQELQITRSTQ